MSFTVVNKRDNRNLKWENGFDPYGSSLPIPTTADNGKVVGVAEGKYNFVEVTPPESEIVVFEIDSSNKLVNATSYDVRDAIEDGKTVMVKSLENGFPGIYLTYQLAWFSSTVSAVFSSTRIKDADEEYLYQVRVPLNEDTDTVEVTIREMKQPSTPTATLLTTTAATEVITDGWNKTIPIADFNPSDYDELVIEIGANQAVAAGQYTITKGGLFSQNGSTYKNIQLHGKKTYMPSEASSEILPTQIYQIENFSVYAPLNDPTPGNVNFSISFAMQSQGPTLVIFGNCVSSNINANLWPSCYVAIWGIKY